MKKIVLTLITVLAISGLSMAQEHPETNWPDFSDGPFSFQGGLCASIMIDGVPVSYEYVDWEMLEIAAFVGNEQRGANIWLWDMEEMFPTTLGDPVYYNNAGETVTFKMYN